MEPKDPARPLVDGDGPDGEGLEVVVTSTASDAHTWNLVYLQLLLEEHGHRVHNLGACVPDGLLVSECVRRDPDLIVVSTVNGHGAHEGRRVIGAVRAHPALRSTPVVIGGKLGVDGPRDPARAGSLVEAGFDAVFEGEAGSAFTAFVRRVPTRVRV